MNEQKLGLDWLVDQLELLKVPGKVLEEANRLRNRLKIIASRQLEINLWGAGEFLALALVFNLAEELCTTTKTAGSIYRHERLSGTAVVRRLLFKDVDEIIQRATKYFNEKIIFFENEVQRRFFSNTATPIAWLEIAEADRTSLSVQQFVAKYEISKDDPYLLVESFTSGGWRWLVIADLAKQIRYKAFGMTEQEEAGIDQFPFSFTLAELAARWETNEKNVIVACEKSDLLWPYLTQSEGMFLHERTIPITTAMIHENLRSGNLRAEYKYGYKGFARLAKRAYLPNRIALEHFHSSRVIDPETTASCVLIDPPFCKYATGKYQFIEIKKPVEPTLYFISDEVYLFEKTAFFSQAFPGAMRHLNSQDNALTGEDQVVGDSVNKFSKVGHCYEIHYQGQKITLKASKGLTYLAALVQQPRKEIHVDQLELIINKTMPVDKAVTLDEMKSEGLFVEGQTVTDEVADQKAIDAVTAEKENLLEELKEAEKEGKLELAEELKEQIEQYQGYLNGAIGKNFKPRKVPDHTEKARKRVFSAISDALEVIRQSNLNDLYEHLFKSIKKGYFCVYMPVDLICWQ